MRRAAAITPPGRPGRIAAGCGGGRRRQLDLDGLQDHVGQLVHQETAEAGHPRHAHDRNREPRVCAVVRGRRRGSSSRSTTRRPARDTRAPSPTPWPKELGFTKNQVKWVPVAFNLTFKPGAKDFDFAMQQISYNPQRAKAVTFSEPYFDDEQSLVALKDKPIAKATSFSDLKDAKLGASSGRPVTTTSTTTSSRRTSRSSMTRSTPTSQRQDRPDRRPGHRLPDRLLHRERPALERDARRPLADDRQAGVLRSHVREGQPARSLRQQGDRGTEAGREDPGARAAVDHEQGPRPAGSTSSARQPPLAHTRRRRRDAFVAIATASTIVFFARSPPSS